MPLSPAFKKEMGTPGVSVPFDTDGFLQGLQDNATYNADGALTGIDKNYIRQQTDAYAAQIQAFIDSQNPAMTMKQFYGFSTIVAENYPILSITLPFAHDPGSVRQYSTLDDLQRHRIAVQLSYWNIDLDEELETLEINYTAPTALVAGKPLTLSYRPATGRDVAMLEKYDGNLFGTPLCLIHMYPQLKLGGVVVDQNVGRDAEISMGLDETLRVKMLQPGEADFGWSTRQNDYNITVGDHIAIVPGLGFMPKDQLQESVQRLSQAVTDGAQDIDRLLGEQLHLTASTYYYQTDTWYNLIAKQAGVRWFRNPSDLIVSRHLTVDWFMGMIPVAVKESTIIIDAPGNRFQALPEQGDWKNRVAFLKTAGLYGSIMEHTVLQELFQQNAVSGVKLLNAAVDNGTAIYEINPQMTPEQQNAVLDKLNLSAETIKIIQREIDPKLGQTVLAPANDISMGNYRGAAIISSTPPDNPMGAFREGYLIARAADGGQITDLIKNLLNSFINPNPADWLDFKNSAQGAVEAVITNSDQIRMGNVPVRETLAITSALAAGIYILQQTAQAMSFMSLESITLVSMALDGVEKFLSKTYVMYIDFEKNPYYFPDYDNGSRLVKFFVLDLLGHGVKDQAPAISVDTNDASGFTCTQTTATSAQGEGKFVFNALNAQPGNQLKVNLKIKQGNDNTTTSGTFYIAKVQMAVDGNRDTEINFDDHEDNETEFWVNNDYDNKYFDIKSQMRVEDDENTADYKKSDQDCEDDEIEYERDLEDFARLHILSKGISSKIVMPFYSFKFVNVPILTNPEINLFEAVDGTDYYLNGNNGNGGLNDHTNAEKQLKKKKLITVSETENKLSGQYIKFDNSTSYFLFEGKSPGSGELALVLKINNKEIYRKTIKLTLRDISEFCRKWRVEADNNDQVLIPSEIQEINNVKYTPKTDDIILYVHGWKMADWEKNRYAETMFKRLWWQGYKGHFGYLDWPTYTEGDFDKSNFRAYQTGEYLKLLIGKLNEPDSPHTGKIRILAHSLGNEVVSEALRLLPEGVHLQAYIATQAAVSAHAYDNSLNDMDDMARFSGLGGSITVPTTPQVLAFYSTGTPGLPQQPNTSYYSKNVSKVASGQMYRYYNIADMALGLWEWGNMLKPDGDGFFNYFYNGNVDEYVQGRDRFFQIENPDDNTQRNLIFEQDRYEIFAFCAESRAKAVGAIGGENRIAGFIGFNLRNAPLKYDKLHYSHSRQFRSNIIAEWPFWFKVYNDFGLSANN